MGMDVETEQRIDTVEEVEIPDLNIGRLDPKSGGRVSPKDCKCDFPTLELAKGEVGPYHNQALYCAECHHRFFTFTNHRD